MKDLLAFSIGGVQIKVPQQINGLIPNGGDPYGFTLISKIFDIALLVTVILALFFIVIGGFKWISSQGDPKQIEGARNTIMYAAIGLGVAFLSFFFVNVLGHFLGVRFFG